MEIRINAAVRLKNMDARNKAHRYVHAKRQSLNSSVSALPVTVRSKMQASFKRFHEEQVTTAAPFFGEPKQPYDEEPAWCHEMRDLLNERHASSSWQNKIIDKLKTIHAGYLAANWTGPKDWPYFLDTTITVLFTEGAQPCWEFLRDHIKNVMAVSLKS